MAKAISGKLPDKVTYFCGREERVSFTWDVSNIKSKKQTITVRPAYISDADNEKTCNSGREWADAQKNSPWRGGGLPSVVERTEDNAPMTGIKIITLEHRGNGGRAYKVVTPQGFYVDLREDVLLDAMLEVGIEKGGILCGEYVWGRVGSQMKLIRVDSELYESLVDATERKETKKIPTKDLKYGHVYQTVGGSHAVYLGRVNGLKNGYPEISNEKMVLDKKDFLKNGFLFWEVGNADKDKIEEDVKKNLAHDPATDKWGGYWKLKIKKSHAYVKCLSKVDIPSDLVAKIRQHRINIDLPYTLDSATESYDNAMKRYNQASYTYYYSKPQSLATAKAMNIRGIIDELLLFSVDEKIEIEPSLVEYVNMSLSELKKNLGD